MKLFCFGMGYAARFVAEAVREKNGEVFGTHQSAQVDGFAYSNTEKLNAEALEKLQKADAVLVSIPPDENGDPVFHDYAEILQQSNKLKWLGVFSTTGVYGDAHGAWVDEKAPLHPQTLRDKNRVLTEQQWLSTDLPVHIFRLSGIYGPGRSAIERAEAQAPVITKPGHVFNRIHVLDIAQAVMASLGKPTPQEIYNLADDLPAGGDEVLSYAYQLVNKIPPQPIPFDKAALSDMAREFYSSNKRIKAVKIKQSLGIEWLYPDYKTGLQQIRLAKM